MSISKDLQDPTLLLELFRKLFNNSTDPLFITDSKLRLENVNSSFENLFEPLEEFQDDKDLKRLFDKSSAYDRIIEILRTDKKVIEEYVVFTDLNDDKIYALLTLLPIEEDNIIKGYQGIIHDESKRLRAQRKLARAEKVALTGRMARTIAHEIRNPLTNISLALANLQESIEAEDDRFMLELIENNADRINDLLTELLDSARPADLQKERISLQQLITDTIELSYDRMELQGIECNLKMHHEEQVIEADVAKVKLALNNIIINAIEAMPAGGLVEIETKQLANKHRLSIRDNGSGISEEDLNKLFDPFYTAKQNGTGLGLTTVQNILERHEWHIDVESELGKGTEFRVYIDL